MSNGTVKTIPDVMHIPLMSRNLLSVGTMADSGVIFCCDKDSCKMTRGSIVIARGVRYGTLYKLLAEIVTVGSGFVSEEAKEDGHDKSMLWHQRLGHIGEKGLSTLATSQMVEGVPDCSMGFGFCEHCLHGKQNQVSFQHIGMRATEVLDLIHSDVFGPTSTPSIGGSRYYVSFIDDFSIYSWIYFIKSKSDVFEKF